VVSTCRTPSEALTKSESMPSTLLRAIKVSNAYSGQIARLLRVISHRMRQVGRSAACTFGAGGMIGNDGVDMTGLETEHPCNDTRIFDL
jgi:hypothetical protein